jgi:cytochrome P450
MTDNPGPQLVADPSATSCAGTATVDVPVWPTPRSCPLAPPDAYAEWRQQLPRKVMLPDGLAWILTRYEDIRTALGDPRFSSDDQKHPNLPQRILVPPAPGINSIFRMDPPDHTRIRRMALKEFSARRIEALRPQVHVLVDQLADDLAASPMPADLVSTFALPLPSMVIAGMLGVPDEDLQAFTAQSRALLSRASLERAYEGYVGMTAYLDQLITDRVNDPQDDLLSRLAVEHIHTGQLSHAELVALARFTLIAGHETTAKQITLTVLSLLLDPDQMAAVRRDPDLVRPVVEESLRYWSISQDNTVRVVDEDLELGGVRMVRGDRVVLAIPGGNHDESVFPEAGRFDAGRVFGQQHLAFGFGNHFCPGAPLARMEMEVALATLIDRFPDMRLAAAVEDLTFHYDSMVYGLDTLPVTL